MADPSLHCNHDACPACEMRREVADYTQISRAEIPCNVCAGKGFLTLTDTEIVRRTCEEARRTYWPEFEKRIRA